MRMPLFDGFPSGARNRAVDQGSSGVAGRLTPEAEPVAKNTSTAMKSIIEITSKALKRDPADEVPHPKTCGVVGQVCLADRGEHAPLMTRAIRTPENTSSNQERNSLNPAVSTIPCLQFWRSVIHTLLSTRLKSITTQKAKPPFMVVAIKGIEEECHPAVFLPLISTLGGQHGHKGDGPDPVGNSNVLELLIESEMAVEPTMCSGNGASNGGKNLCRNRIFQRSNVTAREKSAFLQASGHARGNQDETSSVASLFHDVQSVARNGKISSVPCTSSSSIRNLPRNASVMIRNGTTYSVSYPLIPSNTLALPTVSILGTPRSVFRLTSSRPAVRQVVTSVLDQTQLEADCLLYSMSPSANNNSLPVPVRTLFGGEREVVSSNRRQLTEFHSDLSLSSNTIFNAVDPANMIPMKAYVSRWMIDAHLFPAVYVLSLIYIDRLQLKWPSFIVGSHNIHRVFLISIVVAAKFAEDHHYPMGYLAKVAGVPVNELIRLESQFLKLLDYDLYVSEQQFERSEVHFIGEALLSRRKKRVKAVLTAANII